MNQTKKLYLDEKGQGKCFEDGCDGTLRPYAFSPNGIVYCYICDECGTVYEVLSTEKGYVNVMPIH